MHADDTIYTQVRNGVVVVTGTGPAIRIDGGRLVIRDGPKDIPPLVLTRAEAHRRLRHVIVCGDAGGYVSFDALRWMRDTGVAFSQLDWNGTVIAASPVVPDQPALRRAQALVCSGVVPGAVAAVTRQILSAKLAGQARVARLLTTKQRVVGVEARTIERLAASVARDTDVTRMIAAEAHGASVYWSLWNGVPVRFARHNPERLGPDGQWMAGRRDPWLTFGPRTSLLTGQPWRATTPGNSVLNWLYAVCEIELTLALLTVGLDPGIGLFHVDMSNRASLTLDALEALRPHVDCWLVGYLTRTAFANRDFVELRDGEVRLTHPLNAHLAHTATLWRTLAEPLAGWLRDVFLRAVYRVRRSGPAHGEPSGGVFQAGLAGRLPIVETAAGDPGLHLPARPAKLPSLPSLPGMPGPDQLGDAPVASACRECGRALTGRQEAFCGRKCDIANRAARGGTKRAERSGTKRAERSGANHAERSGANRAERGGANRAERGGANRAGRRATSTPDQALRVAIADRGLTLSEVARACGVTRGAVSQWFINGPSGRPIPERHKATIQGLLQGPK